METAENNLCPTCGMPMNEGDHNHDSAPEQAPAAPAEGGDAGMGGGEAAPEAAPAQPEAPAADAPAEGGEDAGM